ncbi:hypothetical protein [Bordetella sp. 2513F-2]
MPDKLRAALNVERNANGQYEWVITAVEGPLTTLPSEHRSRIAYATEAEARAAGQRALESLRDS